MQNERLYVLVFFIAMLIFQEPSDGKKVVIHVPYKVKKIKHTHTVYKVLTQPHEEPKEEEFLGEEFDHFKK